MEWTRSETLALATNSCSTCHGLGLILGKRQKASPCNCVLRAIFRACFRRFRHCATKEKHMTKVTLHFSRGTDRRMTWGRKDEEYMADFILVSKRTLTEEEYRLFRFHYLLGADWKLCSRRLGMDRGTFFHAAYRIQQKLGRVFKELKPYALFPLDEYFSTTVDSSQPIQVASPARQGGRPIQPPVRQAA